MIRHLPINFHTLALVLLLTSCGIRHEEKSQARSQAGEPGFLALVADPAAGADKYVAVLSLPATTAAVRFCPHATYGECDGPRPELQAVSAFTEHGGRRFFQLPKAITLTGEKLTYVGFVGVDAGQQLTSGNTLNIVVEKSLGSIIGGNRDFGVTFIDYPTRRSDVLKTKSKVLLDIVNHLPSGNPASGIDIVNVAHEATHDLGADIRARASPGNSEAVGGCYVLNNQAVVIPSPRIKKSWAAEFIPKSLRQGSGGRFALYVASGERDSVPMQLVDEWCAYINGALTAIDVHQEDPGVDRYTLNGMLQLMMYTIGLGQATKAKAPETFAQPQFTNFLGYNIQRSMNTYREGIKIKAFVQGEQQALLQALRSSPDAEATRQFLYETFGKEWVDQVVLAE